VPQMLVLDIGTSSVKAVMFDRHGGIVSEAEESYPTTSLDAVKQEQLPSDWLDACKDATRRLTSGPASVELVVLTGTMQSVIPVDASNTSLRAAILYSDGRATHELAELRPTFDARASLTRNAPNEFMAAFKIAWLRAHERAVFDRTAVFHSGAKDYVLAWMTGRAVTDPTAASTVGLLDLNSWSWDEPLVSAVGLEVSRLPEVLAGDQVVGSLLAIPAAQLGLKLGTPVMNGCGDAGASTLGAGIESDGATYVYVGTTAWAAQIRRRAADANAVTDCVYTLAHPTDRSLEIRIGAMLSGGDSAAWASELLNRPLGELDDLLKDNRSGVHDPMFLPYLKGERCPFVDSGVRASFLQLRRSDGAAELHRAVIEGIALAIRTNVDALGNVVGDVLLLGGGALSAHLPQLLADNLQRAVAVARSPAAVTALGGYRLGARALGWADPAPEVSLRVAPRPDSAATAATRLKRFRDATGFARSIATA